MSEAPVKNPRLAGLVASPAGDTLYHLGSINTASGDFKRKYGDVKFVCMGGSAHRAHVLAQRLARRFGPKFGLTFPVGDDGEPIVEPCIPNTDRFALYKVGPILSGSHGMGMPSMSIFLNEITKLVHYAGCTDVIYLRLGTCGGIGVPAGTIVVSSGAFSGALEPFREVLICGRRVKRPAVLDSSLAEAIYSAAAEWQRDVDRSAFEVVKGCTLGTDDFYEGQARLDGALCVISDEEKMSYLKRCVEAGVRNIEMESTEFAAFCHQLGIAGGILCVTLLDRLQGDQVDISSVYAEYARRVQEAALYFISKQLKLEGTSKLTGSE